MTATEAAAALGVSERTVRRAIRDGRLAAEKSGGAYDVDLEAARAALTRRARPRQTVYQAALAEALYLLRAFAHGADAEELEQRHGLTYVEPKPEVYAA